MDQPFATLPDLLQNEIFQSKLQNQLNILRNNHVNRPALPAGKHYIRSWFERMVDAGEFNAAFFINNIQAIMAKKSNLPSEKRKAIEYVCNAAYQETLKFYNLTNNGGTPANVSPVASV